MKKLETPALRPARSTMPANDPGLLPHPSPEPGAPAHPEETGGELLDRMTHAWQGQFTAAVSPAALGLAFMDWGIHLSNAPGKRIELVRKFLRKTARFAHYVASRSIDSDTPACIEPLPQDRRFVDPAWQQTPFCLIYQAFLLQQQWWHNATSGIRGITAEDERIVAFATRQILDVFSPSNFVATNPEVLRQTFTEGGRNFLRGTLHLIEDWQRLATGQKPVGTEAYRIGETIAATPGAVIFRNELIELIQYSPGTATVHPEPILIVPAWIMKYYILDLSDHNSLVRYLVDSGFTVFMISWRNPGPAQRELRLDDYRSLGVEAALAAIGAICPGQPVHGCGYCLGGTLLTIAAAAMARDGRNRLATMALFAAQTDFTEAGELMLFINESQIAWLEDTMWQQGFLDTSQMAGAFRLLRSNDLIWSQAVREYLKGDRPALNDLMAWNADATRLPYRMHSEYLRRLFLHNDLAEGRFEVAGQPVALADIHVPVFAVGTRFDHVAPWRSVHKLHLMMDTSITFVLASGGHNAGIVSEPGRKGREFQILSRSPGSHYLDPDRWLAAAPIHDGSWWPAWASWLAEHSSAPALPPAIGCPRHGYAVLADAPGTYVLDA